MDGLAGNGAAGEAVFADPESVAFLEECCCDPERQYECFAVNLPAGLVTDITGVRPDECPECGDRWHKRHGDCKHKWHDEELDRLQRRIQAEADAFTAETGRIVVIIEKNGLRLLTQAV